MGSLFDEGDKLLSYVVPRPLRVPLHFGALRFAKRGEQAMIARLRELCPGTGRALDIGANRGLYTFALTRLITRVDAFEPQADCAHNLRSYAAAFAPNLQVHQVAISDEPGNATLYVPWFVGRFGKATVSAQASLDIAAPESEAVEVATMRVDDFRFDDVSFVKIDVEGHEASVLSSAIETLARCRPVILIEIEQRHLGPVLMASIFERIEGMGFRGGFYRRGEYRDLDDFDLKADQSDWLDVLDTAVVEERYVNMFVFRPR